MIGILVSLFILVVAVAAVYILLDWLRAPEPLKKLAYLVIVVVVFIVLLDIFGLYHFNLK